jgi:hypothetical protein
MLQTYLCQEYVANYLCIKVSTFRRIPVPHVYIPKTITTSFIYKAAHFYNPQARSSDIAKGTSNFTQ